MANIECVTWKLIELTH